MNKNVSQLQKGQAIVLVALMIVALTGMLALSIDSGNSYAQRRMLQTAADAAAMAGTHLAMEQITNVGGTQNYTAQRNTAIQFANRNGASAPDTITIVWVDNTGAAFANDVSNLPVIPAAFVAPAPPVNNFHIMNDPPTSATSLATRASAANGLSTTISIGPSYYIDPAGQPANDNFALGMNDRIQRSIANPVFAGDTPQPGRFSPYNPRVFMVAVNTSASGANPTTITIFLAFYTQFVQYDASHKVILGGYWVNSSGVPGSGGFGLPTGGTGNPMVFRLTQ